MQYLNLDKIEYTDFIEMLHHVSFALQCHLEVKHKMAANNHY